jgi:hypothetical protein
VDGCKDFVCLHGHFSGPRKKEDREPATFTLPPPALSGSGSKGTSQPLGAPGEAKLGQKTLIVNNRWGPAIFTLVRYGSETGFDDIDPQTAAGRYNGDDENMKVGISFRTAQQRISILWMASIIALGLTCPAASHQTEPAIITALVQKDYVEITIRDAIEPIIAISEVDPKSNADADRVNSLYQDMRNSAPADLEKQLQEKWDLVARNFKIYAGDMRLGPVLKGVTAPEIGDTEQLRVSTFTMTAKLPEDASPVRFSWRADFGPFSIHQAGGNDDGYTELLQGGQTSQPMLRSTPTKEAATTVFVRFVVSGFEHIVPKGIDHILFVLGLFLFSLRIKPILAQVTAFTIAHSITLALASLKIVSLPSNVVEPLIAISIVYVAIENILFANQGRTSLSRVAIVFGFGLLHGLGFASVLSDVGLPASQFLIGLIGFNIGVEFGQLSVILVALLLVGLPFGQKPWYRTYIVIPASGAIAVVGMWWAFERIFL